MKRQFLIRIVSVILTVCMLLPVVPTAFAATYLSYDWTGEDYTREGKSALKFALDDVLYDCYGFVIEYELTKIDVANIPDIMTFEICIGDTDDNWVVADIFSLRKEELEESHRIRAVLERPADIQYLSIICRNDISFRYSLTILEPIYEPEFAVWGHEGYFSDQKFIRGNYVTYPFVLDETIHDCMGFTLHYQLLQVNKGVFGLETPYEVYVQDAGKKWELVHTFNLRNDEVSVDIVWSSPKDVTQVAVIAKAKGKNEYRHYFAVTDAFTMSEYMETYPYTENGYVAAQWSGTKFSRSGWYTYPRVLERPLINCKGFSLEYELREVSGGKLSQNSKCVVYYCTAKGTWVKAKEFKIPAGWASVEVKLSKPETITQVAVAYVTGNKCSYTHWFDVYNPIW